MKRWRRYILDLPSCRGIGVWLPGLSSVPPSFGRYLSSCFPRNAADRTGHRGRGRHRQDHASGWPRSNRARDRGFQVFSARAGQAESVLAYAAVADMLGDVDPAVLAALPDVQRLAVDRVLLRANIEGPCHRPTGVVAAAFAAVLDRLSGEPPSWWRSTTCSGSIRPARPLSDTPHGSSTGRVGMLLTERCDPDCGDVVNWLHLARPDGIDQIRVGPLSLGGLHVLISSRLGRSFPRPTMVRISEISAGNPFYALELARAIDDGSAGSALPATLSELMRQRIGRLGTDTRNLLLAAASRRQPDRRTSHPRSPAIQSSAPLN